MSEEQAVKYANDKFGYTPDMLAVIAREALVARLTPVVKKSKVVKVKQPDGKSFLGHYTYNCNFDVYYDLFEIDKSQPTTILSEEMARYAVECKKLGIDA